MNQHVGRQIGSLASLGYTVGECDVRPWGTWEVLATGMGYTIKRIVVEPGHRLSLQYHQFRSELWTVVSGNALALIDDVRHQLSAGQSLEVPQGAVHRVANVGTVPLVIIEVQMGSRLEETDIVRVQDDYARG